MPLSAKFQNVKKVPGTVYIKLGKWHLLCLYTRLVSVQEKIGGNSVKELKNSSSFIAYRPQPTAVPEFKAVIVQNWLGFRAATAGGGEGGLR